MASRRAGESRVYGGSACRALFMRRLGDILRVYLTEERVRDFGDLLSTCARLRLPYRIVPANELEAITESRHHEGICIVARPRPAARLEDLVRAPGPACILGLSGVANPHNVGAVLRTAAHFGVRGAVFLGGPGTPPAAGPRTSEAGEVHDGGAAGALRLSAAAARTAEGGAEWLDLVAEDDMGRALRVLRGAGFTIAATSSHQHGGAVRELYADPLPARLFLLLGAEDEGLPEALLAAADTVIGIPGTGQVESLNVAAAAAVLLGEHWRTGAGKRAAAREPAGPARAPGRPSSPPSAPRSVAAPRPGGGARFGSAPRPAQPPARGGPPGRERPRAAGPSGPRPPKPRRG